MFDVYVCCTATPSHEIEFWRKTTITFTVLPLKRQFQIDFITHQSIDDQCTKNVDEIEFVVIVCYKFSSEAQTTSIALHGRQWVRLYSGQNFSDLTTYTHYMLLWTCCTFAENSFFFSILFSLIIMFWILFSWYYTLLQQICFHHLLEPAVFVFLFYQFDEF